MNRREFIKKAVQMGGVAALYNLGVTLEQARAWGVLPATIMEPTGDLWTTWDEASEDTLSVDQDGDGAEDTNITFGENTSAGGDETGRGVLTGADLVLSQSGNIAGAVGSPPYRPMDGTDDTFRVTNNWFNAIFAGETEYTLIVKCYLDSSDIEWIFNFEDTNARINLNESAGFLRFGLTDTDNGLEFQSLTNGSAGHDNQVCYVAIWTSATDGVSRAGWCAAGSGSGTNGQPTKWSDFNAGDRVEFAALFDNIANIAAPSHANFFGLATDHETKGRLYYVIASRTCLIDNNS